MAKIAFIGLGHMGGGMAPNLAKAGHEVRAFDLVPEAVKHAAEGGCTAAGSAADAVKDADVVITMLPASKHVRTVYREDVAPNARAGTLLIDCSTIDVQSAREVGEDLKKLGLDLQTFFDISSKASGQSWSMTSYCPVPGVGPDTPADHDYEGGFAAALMLKDLKLAMDAAKAADAYTPMGGEAEELYQRFVDRGGGSKDFSGIIKMIDDSWKPPEE